MFKLCLPLCSIVLILAGASANLEWPASLIALPVSSGKSSQVAPPAPAPLAEASESSQESSSSSAVSEDEAASSVSSSSSGDSRSETEAPPALSSADSADAARLLPAVPVSLPLPLIVAARAGLRTVLTIQEPTVAKVGELVQHVPTAVSHQSQTVVHDHRRLVTPIVAPALRTTQVVRQQPPVVWTLAAAPGAIEQPRLLLLRN